MSSSSSVNQSNRTEKMQGNSINLYGNQNLNNYTTNQIKMQQKQSELDSQFKELQEQQQNLYKQQQLFIEQQEHFQQDKQNFEKYREEMENYIKNFNESQLEKQNQEQSQNNENLEEINQKMKDLEQENQELRQKIEKEQQEVENYKSLFESKETATTYLNEINESLINFLKRSTQFLFQNHKKLSNQLEYMYVMKEAEALCKNLDYQIDFSGCSQDIINTSLEQSMHNLSVERQFQYMTKQMEDRFNENDKETQQFQNFLIQLKDNLVSHNNSVCSQNSSNQNSHRRILSKFSSNNSNYDSNNVNINTNNNLNQININQKPEY
ncbi:hypothetical protein PPERSA_08186 [Pseudocohnilembus persalinus]|uniref:Uncharacterized protein n=1 Tax=Pseudocohnilembus persalinus TaxID=266149 RepID=A0A0V0R3A7_PSEPJ|nr:hypothetical protein PPERSA_08186 [Pseudocohnilembus persalinus]|eukprot:KRX08983.1 hypothetical protein PPERSA_08186 [Pseudocohnilembus persalinus]